MHNNAVIPCKNIDLVRTGLSNCKLVITKNAQFHYQAISQLLRNYTGFLIRHIHVQSHTCAISIEESKEEIMW